MDIDSKVSKNVDSLGELNDFLESYTKLNRKPIMTIINQLKSYKEAITTELNNL